MNAYPHIGNFTSREHAEACRPGWEQSHNYPKPMRPAPLLGKPGTWTLEWTPPGKLNPHGYDYVHPIDPSKVTKLPTSNPFRVIEAEEFAGGAYVEPDWLIGELFPCRGLGMTYGGSGEGKTFFLVDQACAIHRGTAWRDRYAKQTRAVIIVAEGEHFFPLKLRAYAQRHGVSLTELPAVIPVAPNLFKGSDVTKLIVSLRDKGAGYVLIDPLAQCAVGAEESSAKDMGVVLAACKRIETELNCFVHLAHHIGKDASKGPRGTSAFKPAVDCLLHLEGNGLRGTVTAEKVKDAAGGARFGFELEFERLGISNRTGKPFGSLVVKHVAPTGEKSNGRTSPNKAAICEAFAELSKSGRIHRDAVIAAAAQRLPLGKGQRDQRKTHVTTALHALLRDRRLYEDDDGTLSEASAVVPVTAFESVTA